MNRILSNQYADKPMAVTTTVHCNVLTMPSPRVTVKASDVRELREGSTGRVVVQLPQVWAVAEPDSDDVPLGAAEDASTTLDKPPVELAFYRKYTEGMLRRYVKLSLERGRAPSLLGREMFRGRVTSYRVHSFEDVVIFCHDVERLLGRLPPLEQQLVRRIGLQEYTQGEAAAMLGLSLRDCIKRYSRAVDRLTEHFLTAGLLEQLKTCQ